MNDSVFSEVVEAGTGCDGSGGGSGGGGEWCCSEWLRLSILNMSRNPLMPNIDILRFLPSVDPCAESSKG